MDNILALLTMKQKIDAAIAAHLAKSNTTDRDEEYLEWLLNEIRAGRK